MPPKDVIEFEILSRKTGEPVAVDSSLFTGDDGRGVVSPPDELVVRGFTGLFDKNDEKIHDGDLLLMDGGGDDTPVVLVEFINGAYGFKRPWDTRDYVPQDSKFSTFAETYPSPTFKNCFEVIGNRWTDPDIVEFTVPPRIPLKRTYELKNWRYEKLPDGRHVLVGSVYGNPDFEDGEIIKTSPVKAKKSCGCVETRNSIYRLIGKESI